MMRGSSKSWWLRCLLFALAATIIAATFAAYFSPETLVGFADLRLCQEVSRHADSRAWVLDEDLG